MGIASNIEWTEATWNPWHDCQSLPPGCAHCYMYREKKQYGQNPSTVVRGKTTFDAPLKWKKPTLIFTCSWSDFFIEEADAWRPQAWEIIRATPQHTYQILTKRPERLIHNLPEGWPWRNVWLGVSVENPRFYWRANVLREVPAHLRFLSLEPLLTSMRDLPLEGISWVIVGGESGPRCRPIEQEWVADIRDQCVNARVPFFFKQWGGTRKANQGRLLEGRIWEEMPARSQQAEHRPMSDSART
jgi:protein gp37